MNNPVLIRFMPWIAVLIVAAIYILCTDIIWPGAFTTGKLFEGLSEEGRKMASNALDSLIAFLLGAIAFWFGQGIAEGMKAGDKGAKPPAA
ncbi:MAG TPA: hypothetical protein VFA26_23355 [Gemmataceae bacterium]|nr:hypothetical protein [Gemmataceae bacterium]